MHPRFPVEHRCGKPANAYVERGRRRVDVIEFLDFAKALRFNPATRLNGLVL